MSPSEIKKSGTHFDLSIALLIALYEKRVDFNDFFVFGELSLNGEIKDSSFIFPIILTLAKHGKIKNLLVCEKSAEKISKIPNLNIYCVKNLTEAIEFFASKDIEKYRFNTKNMEF